MRAYLAVLYRPISLVFETRVWPVQSERFWQDVLLNGSESALPDCFALARKPDP
jgi:hypothetical protein